MVATTKYIVMRSIDVVRTMIQVVVMDVTAREETKAHATQMESGMAIDPYWAVIVINGCPYIVVAIAYRSRPGRPPLMVIGPQPSMGAVVTPIAVVTRDIGEGVVTHPYMTYIMDIVPLTVSIGHIIHYRRWPPAGSIIHINPFATRVQLTEADDRIGNMF